MDADAATNVAQALQALAAAIQNMQAPPAPPAPPPAAPAAAAAPVSSPYDGDALDLTSRTGTSLFLKGSKTLDSKFTGKVEDLHLFLSNLRQRAQTCRWLGGTHDILKKIKVGAPAVGLNLLTDYGRIATTDVETARAACKAGADTRAKQNAKMMYQSVFSSITESAKWSQSTLQDIDFHEDGPSILHYILSNMFTATFSNAQAMRDKLADFHPKRVKYDIAQVNNYIRSAVKTLRSAAMNATTITNTEILYFQFRIYKKIKALAEWTTKILYLESSVSATPTYSPETLYNEALSLYQRLNDQGLWHPSNRSPKEQAVAMAAKQKEEKDVNQPKKPRNDKKGDKDGKDDRKQPPFANDKDAKEGDTKKWKGKIYNLCPAPHKNSQWHTHKVAERNTYKEWKKEGSPIGDSTSGTDTQVAVDKEKLKKGMAALFPSGKFDTDNLAEVLAAVLGQ